jgi:hypothetical protein
MDGDRIYLPDIAIRIHPVVAKALESRHPAGIKLKNLSWKFALL